MAMLLTILLISTTIYGGVQAPPQRGMSYIEIWIVGMQIPTLIAIFETGYALLRYRRQKKFQESVRTMDSNEEISEFVDIRLYDIGNSDRLITNILLFKIINWMVALTL